MSAVKFIKTNMAQWSATSESGILRKNKPKENLNEIFVFGYACKLFRDDEKASYIDKGKHLIPWMGDEKLKIDRGAISDIGPYEASREGFDAMRWLGLSESDRKIEQLCDKERYYSLHINEEEEQMYKEEEQKRQKANEFQYSYDVPPNPAAQEPVPTVPEAEEEDEEYTPSPSLDVPVDIDIPKTVKENARIEKTALFVCKQGPQMEILIKAKQADNPQFGFLNHNHELYKYYRHVLAAIKSGRYQVVQGKKSEEKQSESADNNVGDDHYLHPSLLSTTPAQTDVIPATIPAIPYKPSANCSYSQLVNRIQGNQSESSGDVVTKPELTYEQQQYYQYYYATQYYEYYKQMAQYQQGNGQSGQNVQPPDAHLDQNVQNYIQQMAYAHYMQNQASNSNPYAQIVSNVSNKEVANPYSALLANIQPSSCPESSPSNDSDIKVKSEVIVQKPLSSLADYGSDSDEDDADEQMEEFKTPTGETQIVIDKMASYVAKNGEKFEEIVKGKGDPRFEFLKDSHEFYKYYRSKIKEFKQNEGAPSQQIPADDSKSESIKSKEKKVIAPVSFSIKKPKDDGPKDIKSALPVEESDEEEGTPGTPPVNSIVEPAKEESSTNETSNDSSQKNGIFDSDDPILEMIDLTDDLEERKDAKRAEDKIKDKLAAAAREKLASVARDRALQQERKKKAAAFLKLKSAENVVVKEGDDDDNGQKRQSRSNEKKAKEVVQIDDSPDDDEERKKRTPKRKKSHKRKHHSKTKHDSKGKKKWKKKRRRSESCSSTNSNNKSS